MRDLLHFLMHASLLLLWCGCWVISLTQAEPAALDQPFTFIWMNFLVFVLVGSVLWVRLLRERKHPDLEDEGSI
jgi:hypothetical protein